jgi:hypothetical protein
MLWLGGGCNPLIFLQIVALATGQSPSFSEDMSLLRLKCPAMTR